MSWFDLGADRVAGVATQNLVQLVQPSAIALNAAPFPVGTRPDRIAQQSRSVPVVVIDELTFGDARSFVGYGRTVSEPRFVDGVC